MTREGESLSLKVTIKGSFFWNKDTQSRLGLLTLRTFFCLNHSCVADMRDDVYRVSSH